MYIDDCLYGIQLITINQLVDIVEDIAGVKLKRNYQFDAPKGVNGRSSDNTKIQEKLGWAPSIQLRDGREKTHNWIYEQYTQKYGTGTKAFAETVNA